MTNAARRALAIAGIIGLALVGLLILSVFSAEVSALPTWVKIGGGIVLLALLCIFILYWKEIERCWRCGRHLSENTGGDIDWLIWRARCPQCNTGLFDRTDPALSYRKADEKQK